MSKLSEDQIDKILKVRAKVTALQEECDKFFDDLVEELGLSEADKTTLDITYAHPVNILFDLIYNAEMTSDFYLGLGELIAKMEESEK